MAITNIYKGDVERSDIQKIYKGNELIYEALPPEPPTNVVRFVSASPRTITPKYTDSGITLQYSVDYGETWITTQSGVETTMADEHWFRGQATGTKSLFKSNTNTNAWAFSGSSDLEVYGNLNYLLCDTLGDEVAPTTLGNYAYANMFRGCTSLTTAPELPATTIASNCYTSMFYGCTSLTKAPELPATTIASNCYASMFYGCTSLTTPPELPATTIADSCYEEMFRDCTSLTTPPELPATTLADWCYATMFQGCTSLTTPPELPATTVASYSYYGMFRGCTSLTTAPELPATTLADWCYATMFQGCTSLTTVPKLPSTTLQPYCYNAMFKDCTSFKVHQLKIDTYQHTWRIPTSGTGTIVSGWGTSWHANMLNNTGGAFKDNPSVNTTYYVENQPV